MSTPKYRTHYKPWTQGPGGNRKKFSATLQDGKLMWSDGDVWTRCDLFQSTDGSRTHDISLLFTDMHLIFALYCVILIMVFLAVPKNPNV